MIEQRMQVRLDTPVKRDAMWDIVGIAHIRAIAPQARTPQASGLTPAPF